MSLKLELLAAICLISSEPPTEAHDIYAPLKDRWGNSCCNGVVTLTRTGDRAV